MIVAAFADFEKRKSVSRQALLNYISENYGRNNKKTINRHYKIALESCVIHRYLQQIKGKGANGSFA